MRLSRISLVFSVALAMAHAGPADGAGIREIGAHQPILTVEKNVNPQNKMIVYTKVDAQGRFATDPGNGNRPVLDFYWLMDGRNYKAVNRLIKKEIRKRFAGEWRVNEGASHFIVDMNDLKEVNSDIRDPKMEIITRGTGGGANVEAQMNLGPSDGHMRIRLVSIYTEGRAFPPAVQSVTLKGEEVVNGTPTGRAITRKYSAEGRGK